VPTDQRDSPIRRILDHAFSLGNLAVVDEELATDYIGHYAFGGAPKGADGLKWLIVMFRTAFPDLHCTVEDEISADDKFAAHWTMRGTHNGLFLDNPPTGRTITAQGLIFGRTENGRLIEDWIVVDQMGILQQLGIVPPPRRH
jgi:predicted ester cyclase